jgi:hypothetical protein
MKMLKNKVVLTDEEILSGCYIKVLIEEFKEVYQLINGYDEIIDEINCDMS